MMNAHFKDISQALFISSRHIVVTLITSVIFALFITFGLSLKWFGEVQFSNPLTFVLFALSAIAFYLAFSALSRFLDGYSSKSHVSIQSFTPYAIAAILALVICWGSVFLASFPGYYAYDTRFFNWYLEDGTLDSSYSVLYVLFVSNIIRIGMYIFGTFDSGVAFYIVLQLFILIAFVIHILYAFFKTGCQRWMMIAFIAFYALDPIIAMMANCTTRDTMFSLFFVLLAMNVMSLVRDSKNYSLRTHKNIKGKHLQASNKNVFYTIFRIIAIVALMLLCICYRSHCLYVLILFGAIVAFYAITKNMRSSIIVLLACIISSAFLYGFWNTSIVSSISASEQEESYGSFLCVINMQMAYACANENIATTDKLEELGIDKNLLANCSKDAPVNSDSANLVIANALKTKEDQDRYIGIWLDTITKYPATAITAFLQLTKGAWSPFESINAYSYKTDSTYYQTKTSLFACVEDPPVVMESKIPWLQDFLWKVSRDDLLGSNPLLAWSVSTPFFLWLYITAFMRALITKNRALTITCILFACYILSLFIGPVVMTRYYLPLYLAAPLFIYSMFNNRANEAHRTHIHLTR